MKINLNQLKLFNGLYENIWIDSELLQEYDETVNLDTLTLDTKGYLNDIAESYRNKLASVLDIDLDSIKIYETYSPRFYNYDTDNIILELTDEKAENKLNEFLENENLEFFESGLFIENIELFFENCK